MDNPLKRDSLLGMLGAPIVWAVHFLLCYVAVSLICDGGYPKASIAGMTLTELIVAGVTLAAGAALLSLGMFNYRKWRSIPRTDRADGGATRFMALCSVMLCGLSLVGLIWVAFPAFVLPSCAT
jgi:hypothetical protein